MSKSRVIAALVCAAMLVLSVVSPAVGGPSLSKVAKTAKKALSTAKKANNRALNARDKALDANDSADQAYDLANTANTNANTAMARGAITLVDSPTVSYGTSPVATAIAFCPPGQRVVSGGGANVGDEQLAASLATDDRSGWGVIGVDLVDNGGEYVQAQALCAPTGQAVAASRRVARREIANLAARIERARPTKRRDR